MNNIKNVNSWLAYLYYDLGKQNYDFYLSILTQEFKSKWRKYSEVCFDNQNTKNIWFLERVNQRQILPCEIVLDLESKEQLLPIVRTLKKMNVKFYIFTANRGYHIHLWFNRKLSEKEKSRIIKYFGADMQKANEKNLIALEFVNHWKSGKEKELVKIEEVLKDGN